MQFRRRRWSGHTRRAAEPVYWSRVAYSQSYTTLTNNNATVFDPTTFTTGNVDTIITIMAVKLAIVGTYLPTAAANSFTGQLGLSVCDINASTFPSSSLGSAFDARTDWMLIDSVVPVSPSIAANDPSYFVFRYAVKARRRIHQDERLILNVFPTFTGGAAAIGQVSVLWRRTPKR